MREETSSHTPQQTSNESVISMQERLYIAVILCIGVLGLIVLIQNLPVIEQR